MNLVLSIRILLRNCWKLSRHLTTTQIYNGNLQNDSKLSEILNFLNTANENDLEQSKLAKRNITKILEHRQNYGLFTSLNELITITGISLEKIKKLNNDLFKNNSTLFKTKFKTNPVIVKEQCKKIESVVSLDISLPYLTLAHLSRNMDLYDWCRISVSKSNPKYNIHSNYNEALRLASKIPKADLYLMEEKQLRPKSLTHVPHMIMQTALEAFLLTLLNDTNNSDHKQLNVVLVRNSSVPAFLDILIGTERVTGQDVVRKLLKGEPIPQFQSISKLNVSEKLYDLYNIESAINKEFLSNSLLLCLAFYELVVFQEDNLNC